jgi:hypothetical protein
MRRSFYASVWCSLLISVGSRAGAQQPVDTKTLPKFTASAGVCPDPAAVEREILNLVPVERRDLLRNDVRVDIDDLGDLYRVTVSKNETSVKKSYSDKARDCEGRARFAAVFAVLTVMPPDLDLEPPEAPAPPPPPPPKVTVAPPPPPLPPPPFVPVARLEASGLVSYAPAILKAPELANFGGELRVGLGRGWLSGTLAVAYNARSTFELARVRGEVSRLPGTIGVRMASEVGSFRLAADLGVLAVLERVRAVSLSLSRSSNTIELGARLGFQIEHPVGARLAPFLGVYALLVPGPAELVSLPKGVLGNLPYLWIGGAAGLSLGL